MSDFTNKLNLAYEQLLILEMKSTLTFNSLYIAYKVRDKIDSEEDSVGLQEQGQGGEHPQSEVSTSANKKLKLRVPKLLRERLQNELYRLLERATTEYMYFWQLIQDENPPISKLYSSLKESQIWIRRSLDFWSKNEKYLRLMISAQEIYGRFLKEIVFQREEGERIINEAVMSLKKNSQFKTQVANLDFLEDIGNMEGACLIIKSSSNVSDTNILYFIWMKFILILKTSKFLLFFSITRIPLI